MMFVLATVQGVNGHQYFWLDGAYQSFKRGQVGMPAGVEVVKRESFIGKILHEILSRARLTEIALPQGIDEVALRALDLLAGELVVSFPRLKGFQINSFRSR